ncbi:MAG: PucR family transcriptional regulator [Christensenellales bacterium]
MNKTTNDEIELGSLCDDVKALFSTENIVDFALESQKMQFLTIFSNENIQNILKDDEIMSTIKIFFDNNLNISQASKNGFMHRNTLIYRLDKVKKHTGLNLKNFDNAIIFANLVAVYKKMFNH